LSAKKDSKDEYIVYNTMKFSDLLLEQNKGTIAIDTLYKCIPFINNISGTTANQLLESISNAHLAMKNDSVSFKQKLLDNNAESIRNSCKLLLHLIEYYTNNNNLKKAAESIERATALSSKLNDPDLNHKILHKRAVAQYKLSYYNKALKSFTTSYNFHKNTNHNSITAEALRYIAEIEFIKLDYSNAQLHFSQALKIDTQNHNKAIILKCLAQIDHSNGNYPEASNKLLQAINLSNQDKNNSTELLYLLGGAYYMQSEISKAMSYYDSAIVYAKQNRDFNYLGKSLRAKANCFIISNNDSAAIFYLKNAYQAAEKNFESRVNESYARENAYYNNIYQSVQITNLRKEQYIKELELKQIKTGKLQLQILLIGSGILIIILASFFIQNKRFNKTLKEKNDVIDGNNQELISVNKALSNSQLNLLKSNKIKDRMFSIITHDVKGALFSVDSLLQNKDIPDANGRSINIVKSTIKLINHHIKWAVSQTNHINVDKTLFELRSIIDRGLDLFWGTIKTKEIKLNIIGIDNRSCNTDVKMLNLIFRNLLSNAIKHTPNNETITITAFDTKENTIISIADMGSGINEKDAMSIFKSPHQDNSNINSGSGLYLSYKFAKAYGGNIWFENNTDKGCTFYVSIPK